MMTAERRPPKPTCPSVKSKPRTFLGRLRAWLAVTVSPKFLSRFKVFSSLRLLIAFLRSRKVCSEAPSRPRFYSATKPASSLEVSTIATITEAIENRSPISQKKAARFPAFSLSTPSRNLTLARIYRLSKIQ